MTAIKAEEKEMSFGRRANLVTIIIFLVLIVAFAFSYNASFSAAIRNTVRDDRELLQQCNREIITQIKRTSGTGEWQKIIDGYDSIVISISDSSNDPVVKNGTIKTALNISVRSPFEYQRKAYLITSTVHLFKNLDENKAALLEFVTIEFLIVSVFFILIALLLYTIMLRPYRAFYRAIEEYEKTGKFVKRKVRGYIGRVYQRFYTLTQKLDGEKKNQQRIIASISHDIKTPLTSIMGYTEQLQKGSISPERKKRYLEKVYAKSKEIQFLVDEFDEYLSYNMENAVSCKPVEIQCLCKTLTEEYTDELENESVMFRVENYSKHEKVMIDELKMRRVFGNIIANSLKHFKSDNKIILVRVTSTRKIVTISISDNGEGVPDSEFEMIFEPLYTSDKGRKVAGLGLTICKEIVESHGGKIYAKKADLGGLEICIELPIVK